MFTSPHWGINCCGQNRSSYFSFKVMRFRTARVAADATSFYRWICKAIYNVKGKNKSSLLVAMSNWRLFDNWAYCLAPIWSRDGGVHSTAAVVSSIIPHSDWRWPSSREKLHQASRSTEGAIARPANVPFGTHGCGSLALCWGRALDYRVTCINLYT